MLSLLNAGALIAGSYLLGSLCTAYYVMRFKTGRDVRDAGSGTAGARNVGRELGKAWFTFTFAGDTAKGALAVYMATTYSVESWVPAAAAVAVILGHIYPVQLDFRGGKGVATLLGVLLIFIPKPVLVLVFVLVVAAGITRNQKLCGLAAIALVPLVAVPFVADRVILIGITAAVGLVLTAHRHDIAGLAESFRNRQAT